jgi:hypothetical protein
MRLDMHSRTEVVKANYRDYQRAGKKGKKELLDRLVPTTGLNRDYLAHKLGSYKAAGVAPAKGGKRKRRADGKRGGRPAIYWGKEFTGSLDGDGHTIRNLHLTATVMPKNKT